MLVNTFATIGIVFTNKAIFSDRNLVKMPVSFAAFHFACTSMTLFIVSRFGAFKPKALRPLQILPLCFAFCGNVILPNLSLAFSSVTFYQLVRILLTPGTALLNYLFYNTTISTKAIAAIVPICVGVGITTYYDALSKTSTTNTSIWGVIFALAGVTVSCVYTIWIGTFAKKYQVSSMQLLYNQAPWSVLMLLVCVPFSDTIPPFEEVSRHSMGLVLLSGAFAILINVSQFFIIHGTSALTSTIVGHLKTCSIVSLGWFFGGKMNNMSLLGVIIALGGIFTYSAIQQKK
ncbi:triose-phosphate transporter family-domain-containing protein [Protomyces lactucae-debilis]|uniref:Triose-phosphate transporter family-domain-containing protein n=1 Tax=Protomyces lactucae-debilis TaxID=2754530 RepID=A0A1Y2F891_PROLT|nr:triose-phosphate transporter family-domain-containing protein [Protomyces lactucae-debilis]ORY79857.1 triose-phosphate transporter family-domain-containing protein [Protomyces lactucae-debilis]